MHSVCSFVPFGNRKSVPLSVLAGMSVLSTDNNVENWFWFHTLIRILRCNKALWDGTNKKQSGGTEFSAPRFVNSELITFTQFYILYIFYYISRVQYPLREEKFKIEGYLEYLSRSSWIETWIFFWINSLNRFIWKYDMQEMFSDILSSVGLEVDAPKWNENVAARITAICSTKTHWSLRRSSLRIPSGKRNTKQFQFLHLSVIASRSALWVCAWSSTILCSFVLRRLWNAFFFLYVSKARSLPSEFFFCNNTTDFLIMYSKELYVPLYLRLHDCYEPESEAFIYKNNDNLSVTAISANKRKFRVTAGVACEQQPTPEYSDTFREMTLFSNHQIYWAHSTLSNMKWIMSTVTRAPAASQVVGAAKNSHLPFITCQLAIMDEFYCLYIAPCPWRCALWTTGQTLGEVGMWEEVAERFLLFTSNLNGARKIRWEWETSTNTLSGPIKFSLLPKLMDSRNEWCWRKRSHALAHNVMDRSISDAFSLGCE